MDLRRRVKATIVATTLVAAGSVPMGAVAGAQDLSGLTSTVGDSASLIAPLAGAGLTAENTDPYAPFEGGEVYNAAALADSMASTGTNGGSGGAGTGSGGASNTTGSGSGGSGSATGTGTSASGSTASGGSGSLLGVDTLGSLFGSVLGGSDGKTVAQGGTAPVATAETTQGKIGMNREADQAYQQAMEDTLEGELKLHPEVIAKISQGTVSMLPVAMNIVADQDTMTTVANGMSCGIGMATAATALVATGATAAAAGGAGGAATGGLGAAAAAPVMGAGAASAAAPAIQAAPKCIGAAGGAMKAAGVVLNAYENNPDLPQLIDVVAQLDPESGPLGRRVWERLPDEIKENPGNMERLKMASHVAQNMSRVKFGQTLTTYGAAVHGVGNGNTAAMANLVPSTLALGMGALNAGLEGVNGSDMSLILPGVNDVETVKKLTGRVGGKDSGEDAAMVEDNAIPTTVSRRDISKVENIGSTDSDDNNFDDRVSSRSKSGKDDDDDDSSSSSSSRSTATSTSRSDSDDEDSELDDNVSSRGEDNGPDAPAIG